MINFKLVSPFELIQRRSFELVDPAILKPTNLNPLLDGEFLELDAYKMKRGAGLPGAAPAFACFAERGRYETQAIQKVPMLYMGWYEADTKIMSASGLAVGDILEVSTIAIATIDKRGLQEVTTGRPIGYVTRLPANNNGFLRFIRNQ